MLSLQWPWLLCLLPLPWLYRRLLRASDEQAAIHLPFLSLPSGDSLNKGRTKNLPALTLILAWAALVIAATRPLWLGEPITLPASGRDIVLAVDLSGSMDERDIAWRGGRAQRLEVVQAVAGEFIDGRRGDRIALILFGEQAYLQSPLSLDRPTTHQLLDEAEVGLAGQKTAIGDAIGLGVKHLLEAGKNEDKVIILLTDGENTAGRVGPHKAAELAAQSQVRIHTIGFSGEQNQRLGMFMQRRGSGIDEATLKHIAKTTNGQFFVAQSVQALQQVYELLDKIEPVEVEELSFRPRHDLFHWPLGVCLFLLFGLLLRGQLSQLGRKA